MAELDAYADLLATMGVERGLIGPREVPRLWQRHLLNCAVVAMADGLIPTGASVIDVGSGAGLPGLVWALTRPDLRLTLLEPLQRRWVFLTEAVAQFDLGDRVEVVRGRAEDRRLGLRAPVVTARAVAPLERLAGWTLPLAAPGGVVLAIKGADVAAEIAAAGPVLARFGGGAPEVLRLHRAGMAGPTTVLAIQRLR